MVTNLKQVLDPAEAEGLIKNVGKVFENGGEEGLDPNLYSEDNGIVTIEDALARPDLFPHPEDSSVAGFLRLSCRLELSDHNYSDV